MYKYLRTLIAHPRPCKERNDYYNDWNWL